MLGDFLEISVDCRDVLASVRFYEQLGFVQVPVGETWSHKYGVITDGRVMLGLHDFRFPSPSLTFVISDLRKRIEGFEEAGVSFEFIKVAENEFNEAGFFAPDRQIVTLLEARTFSPPSLVRRDFSLLGYFSDYRLPVRARSRAQTMWEALGFVPMDTADEPWRRAEMVRTGLNVVLDEDPELTRPALVFADPEMDAVIEKLRFDRHEIEVLERDASNVATRARLATPDDLDLLLVCREV